MATATKVPPSPPPAPGPKAGSSRFLRWFDAIFRFLASLKLAVISLATLAGVLCYATFFNSWHGLTAAQEVIYQSTGFALLLAFLGMNILCAALIRYPWTKRQTGFVITHAGLLIVIFGSWWSAQYADEGQLGMLEGQTSSQLIRTHKPVILVKAIDPHTGGETGTFTLPFRPGSFDWPEGKTETLSRSEDPFKLTIKKFYNASGPRWKHVEDPQGAPMIKLRPMATPPGAREPMDVFATAGQNPDRNHWMVLRPENPVRKIVRDVTPARYSFSYADRPEAMEDFLHPPEDTGKEGVARVRYTDRAGKDRLLDIKVDDAKAGDPIPLSDSDLVASYVRTTHTPVTDPRLSEAFGGVLDIVEFDVRKGDAPAVKHNGYAGLPMIPNVIPGRDNPGGESPQPLIRLDYFYPPIVDPQVNRLFGVVEVMGDQDGRLAYRVYERGTPAKLRSSGMLKVGEEVTAFGGNPNMPMTMTFRVEEYFTKGREDLYYGSVDLPKEKKDNAISAVLAEMTVDGKTKEVWLRRSGTFDPDYQTVTFPGGMYEVAFDSDRLDLGFSLKLKDFDVGFDPGTNQASTFRSEVELTDKAAKIENKPISIYMNHPLDYRNWRFFQSNYVRYVDPETRQETGEFQSIFQVAKDPGREMKYAGCIIVVLGAFVQFYMRAGLFSDGGKLERERAAARAKKRLAAKGKSQASADADEAIDL
ncbi:cytochrome c biogenesis protein ResB [Tundrisphaera sp. TA3]|uniref:cytochrome c biogenesis protein ResB n=1 Tax=Tundrisphaera sp. TA3 TaxID=3435775 RepID=UPI003EB8FCB5